MVILHYKRYWRNEVVVEKQNIPKYRDVVVLNTKRYVVDKITYDLPYPHVSVLLIPEESK